MFNFLIGSEVNDESVRLKAAVDRLEQECLGLSYDDAKAWVSRVYPDNNIAEPHRHEVIFRDPSLRHFQADIDRQSRAAEGRLPLHVHGYGPYSGFMLVVEDGEKRSSHSPGMNGPATGAAKKLTRLLAKKFGYQDISRRLNRLSSIYR